MATAAVGTEGEVPGKIEGVIAFGPDCGVRLGPKYDGGSRSCFNVARYTCADITIEYHVRVDNREVQAPYLRNRTGPNRFFVKFLENFVEWSLEHALYDPFGVTEIMRLSTGMQFP